VVALENMAKVPERPRRAPIVSGGSSSDVPSLEGCTVGAIDRDLAKDTAKAFMDGYTGSNMHVPAPSAPKPAKKK
jgi:hypothetical protein